MSDPFADSDKEKLLESCASPIVEKSKRCMELDLSNDELNQDTHQDENNTQSEKQLPSSIDQDSFIKISRKRRIMNDDSIDSDTTRNTIVSLSTGDENPFCYFCHGTDNLVKCTGGCGRSYHLRCIGMKLGNREKWKCKLCRGHDLKSSNYHKKHCLRDWYFKSAGRDADGNQSLIIEGIVTLDNSVWHCSSVDHLLDSTHFVTVTGSIYCLIGKMNEQKSLENGFKQEVINQCLEGIPQNWRDILSEENSKSVEPIISEQSMMVKESVKKEESSQDNSADEVNSSEKSDNKPSKKKARSVYTFPAQTIVLEEPEEKIAIDEELHVPVRRSSRHHQPPLPFWENSYMIYNERLGRSEVVIGPNSSVKEIKRIVNSKVEAVQVEEMKESADIDDSFIVKSEDTRIESSYLSDEEDIERKPAKGKNKKNNGIERSKKETRKKESSKSDANKQRKPRKPRKPKEKVNKELNWSEDDIAQLKRAVSLVTVSTRSSLFWKKVAEYLKGHEPSECKQACKQYNIQLPNNSSFVSDLLSIKLSKKGSLKRREQMREVYKVIDEKDSEKKEIDEFDGKRSNSDWSSAFDIRTPSISRVQKNSLNTSVLDQSVIFEQLDDVDKDRVILSAEKTRNKPKVVPHKGLPQARRTVQSVDENSKGMVFGYISSEGDPVIEVQNKEQDLLDEAQEELSSDSLLDY